MNNSCETYQQDLFEFIEGELSEESQSALEAHLSACPPCAAELSQLQELEAALESLGAQYSAQDPLGISIVTPALVGAEALRQAELIAFLDDELAPPEKHGLKARLAARPTLQQELQDLRRVDEALHAHAHAFRPSVPAVDLLDAVMQGITADHSLVDFSERRALKQVEQALIQLGEELASQAAPVDLVAAVMAAVPGSSVAPGKVVPLRTRPKTDTLLSRPKSRRGYWWVSAAAAACFVIALGLIFYTGSQDPAQPNWRISKAENANVIEMLHPAIVPQEQVDPATASPGPVPPGPRQQPAVQASPRLAQHEDRRARFEGPKLQDVLNARRKSMMEDAQALASMAEWSSLSEEEARAILARLGWTTESVLGAAQFLQPQEAAAVLQAAVAADPDDPYLRYALAKNLNELARFDEGREQLAAWSSLDPENSLALYMDADLLFQQGQTDDALTRLAMAGNMSRASVYASESAQHHQQALISNGMKPQVASLIAASLAGSNEYSDLVNLGEQLLQYGKEYESAGDYTTAEQIYQAVQDMGVQLDQNATYANVRLAGTDIQMSSVNALMGLYQVLGSPAGQQLMQAALGGISASLSQITNIFSDYTSLFNSLSESELLGVTNSIIRQGDASVYPDYFGSRL